MPCPRIDDAIAEAAYAFDTLRADGVAAETNHHGIYMGDRRLDPLFAELNRRRAVVFMHPTSPTCPCCQTLSLGFPRPMIEFTTLRRLHYDLAGYPLPRLAPALLEIADPGRIFYGSDWPFTPLPAVAGLAAQLDATPLFDHATRQDILRDNALILFPRLRRC